MKWTISQFANRMCVRLMTLALVGGLNANAFAVGPVVPGSGQRVTQVGDDFEEENWEWIGNFPKSSTNLDRQVREPSGYSSNQRWFESTYRGQPDIIKIVPAPPGGLPHSKHAMSMRTLQTGVPGVRTREHQQDDVLLNISTQLGGHIPVSWYPNFLVRVYMPPFEQWERRTGTSLGIRADLQTTITKKTKGLFFARSSRKLESYWPGFFIQFNSKASGFEKDSAVILIRSDQNGQDFQGPTITEPGWWTFGMSFTPDGRVHYFAKPGVGRLTAADHISSQFPYGYRAEGFNTFFFNVVNSNDGRTWSTEWIIDDPEFYYSRR